MLKKYTVILVGICALCLNFVFGEKIIYAAKNQPAIQVIENEDQFLNEVYQHLLNRENKFTIVCNENIGSIYKDDSEYLFEAIFDIDKKTSDDFDYLRYNIKESQINVDIRENKIIFNFDISYYESIDELKIVNEKIKKVLTKLKLEGNADEVKIRKIHDYVVKWSSPYLGQEKFSAYDVLVKKSASSRGYALITYKMLTEANIPSRIVVGKMGSKTQVWNIVKLDGKWYYLDSAADDDNCNALVPVRYNYFLVGSKTFNKNHTIADSYQTVDFESEYPISIEDYPKRNKLILAADAERIQDKSGVGVFNEAYDGVSNVVVDSFEKVNDKVCNILLDGLSGIFNGV